MSIPDVLLSGDHDKIEAWRDDQRRARTAARRPDLLQPDGAEGTDGEDSTDTHLP